jgi:hypothetical protein
MTAYQGLGRIWLMDPLFSENFPFAAPFTWLAFRWKFAKIK